MSVSWTEEAATAALNGYAKRQALLVLAALVAVALLAILGAVSVAADPSPMMAAPATSQPSGSAPASPQPSGSAPAGVRFEYQVVASDGETFSPALVARVRDIITARMVSYGVDGSAAVEGTDRVTVDLPADPSGTDRAELRKLITTTGRLDFIGVPDEFANRIAEGEPLPGGMAAMPLFSGDQIASAAVGSDNLGRAAIELVFTDAAAQLFDGYAAGHQGDRFAIVLDGRVLSAPVLQATHFGGKAQISGNFTSQTANDLVTLLDFGALPLDVVEVAPSPAP